MKNVDWPPVMLLVIVVTLCATLAIGVTSNTLVSREHREWCERHCTELDMIVTDDDDGDCLCLDLAERRIVVLKH